MKEINQYRAFMIIVNTIVSPSKEIIIIIIAGIFLYKI